LCGANWVGMSKERIGPAQIFHLAKGTFALGVSLHNFFHQRITVEQAEEEIEQALDRCEESLRDLARPRSYENPSSPYLKLLRVAGCEFADLRETIHRHGLGRTLERLAREGGYLTSDEYKGKKGRCAEDIRFGFLPGNSNVRTHRRDS
jgi:hypothetical protein